MEPAGALFTGATRMNLGGPATIPNQTLGEDGVSRFLRIQVQPGHATKHGKWGTCG